MRNLEKYAKIYSMAEKKIWLVRTKNKKILGPISYSKLFDLITNGKLRGDDEVCSGNGHWISVSEKDLVERYVVNKEPQGFNPVSDAPQIYGVNNTNYPKGKDLAYPKEKEENDITLLYSVESIKKNDDKE